MLDPKKISVKNYDYPLTEDKIAKYPARQREESNMLIYDRGNIIKDRFKHIHHYISRDNLLVFNNAKVISARLFFQKETGAKIEIFCLEPDTPSDYATAFQQNKTVRWKCMVGNLKKWKNGVLKQQLKIDGKSISIKAHKIRQEENQVIVQFIWDRNDVSFGEILDHAGKVPIPPYLKRESESLDHQRYQTVYSKIKGSVAAPTAGLHFSKQLIDKMKRKGIQNTELTLHVGAGTFRPVQSETIDQHSMHLEHFAVSLETIEKLIKRYNKILAIGTTSVRTLESLYWIGVKMAHGQYSGHNIRLDQWEHLELPGDMEVPKALERIKNYLKDTGQENLIASTRIMITPGYRFKLTHGLVTNFHLPKSSLLMLIAAFVGDDWKRIYDFALKNDFRFLSYGDSSLLYPAQ
jgi:S-adenosylmethionine:tRNA ribosyltransferase-isomerase